MTVFPQLTELTDKISKNGLYVKDAEQDKNSLGYKKISISIETKQITETEQSSDIINSSEIGTIYKYIGVTNEYFTNGYLYLITE